MSSERVVVACTRYPSSYARRSSELNWWLPKSATIAGNGVGFEGVPGGITAEFNRRPSSVRAGVLTARDTAVQIDWLGVRFQSNLALGSISNPVNSLRSNLEPSVICRRLSTKLISS